MGNDIDKLEFMTIEVNSNIDTLKNKVKKNKNKTSYLSIFAISLSALITLTLGFDAKEFQLWQKNLALILGAILTIVNGAIHLFNYKQLWVRQKKTLLSLYQIKNKIGFLKSSKNIEDSQVAELFAAYVDVWECDSTDWVSIHHQKSPTEIKAKENKYPLSHE